MVKIFSRVGERIAAPKFKPLVTEQKPKLGSVDGKAWLPPPVQLSKPQALGALQYEPLVREEVDALASGQHQLPHNVLGIHEVRSGKYPASVVRTMVPGTRVDAVTLLMQPAGKPVVRIPMQKIHPDGGVFEVITPHDPSVPYQLEITANGNEPKVVNDAYRVRSAVTADQVHEVHNVNPRNLANVLGANEHTDPSTGLKGYVFALWAPNAGGVGVVGEFNDWVVNHTPMSRVGDTGVWQVFVPDVKEGTEYKFAIKKERVDGHELHTDPVGKFFQVPPGSAAITVAKSTFQWQDAAFRAEMAAKNWDHAPESIMEVHPTSWKTHADGTPYNWRELVEPLAAHLEEAGFTSIELMGVNHHPYKPSWGYQVTGYFAPDSRMGSPDDFRFFVNEMHKRGVPVLFDWVPAHTPKNPDALHRLDGTSLYSHNDPRQGSHPDWKTDIFNFSRNEVDAFLRGSASHMLDEFHGDGARVDAVASMLWRSFGRERGQAILNPDGTEQNWDSVAFLRRLNTDREPYQRMHAEESSDWPKATHPVEFGGLGFDRKWNLGIMHDFLDAFAKDYPNRRVSDLTQVNFWAVKPPNQGEHNIIGFSHDEVVHGKGSMLNKMPGTLNQKADSLRSFYARLFAYPGDKLNMMGNEFGQKAEWNYDTQVSWDELKDPLHDGIFRAFSDANKGFVREPALHQYKDTRGFTLLSEHNDKGIEAFLRRGFNEDDDIVVVTNVSLKQTKHRIRVPHADGVASWREVLNTQSAYYGGNNVGNLGELKVEAVKGASGPEDWVEITVPANSTLWLKKTRAPVP